MSKKELVKKALRFEERGSPAYSGTGKGGGYILAPAHRIPPDVPMENILAFIDEARNQPSSHSGAYKI